MLPRHCTYPSRRCRGSCATWKRCWEKELMIRGPRRITLTEEGLFLKKRAEEILSLASHTEEELRSDDTELNGTIRIGSAESDSVRFLMHAAHDIQARYPHLHFHITSGDGQR